MAITLWGKWALAFHDYTSNRAWPRVIMKPANDIYKIKHPNVNHIFVTKANSKEEAEVKAYDWFKSLEIQLGGNFILE